MSHCTHFLPENKPHLSSSVCCVSKSLLFYVSIKAGAQRNPDRLEEYFFVTHTQRRWLENTRVKISLIISLAGFSYFWIFFLHVDDTAQLLDTVQQDIALLDGLLVLSVLCVGSVGLDNAVHLVNNAVQTASRDELGQIPIVLHRTKHSC